MRQRATGLEGAGWTCALARLTRTRSDVLTHGDGYLEVTLTVLADGHAPLNVVVSVTVSGGGETNKDDDTIAMVASISQCRKLSSALSTRDDRIPNRPLGGYAIVVSNAGYQFTNRAITVATKLPKGLASVRMRGDGWTWNSAKMICMLLPDSHPAWAHPYPVDLSPRSSAGTQRCPF